MTKMIYGGAKPGLAKDRRKSESDVVAEMPMQLSRCEPGYTCGIAVSMARSSSIMKTPD
jgi:hypothetical protein